jgi:hypothetical protein
MDATIRGHVFCSFLALVVLKELEARLEKTGVRVEWADVKRDLRALQEVELESDGRKWYLRTELRGVCHDVLQAVGVADQLYPQRFEIERLSYENGNVVPIEIQFPVIPYRASISLLKLSKTGESINRERF